MSFFSRVLLGVWITIIALVVVGVVLMSILLSYFPGGHEPYAEKFMSLEEVQALYRVYPMAESGLNADGHVSYTAIPDDWSGTIELAIYHERHTFDVFGMRLTCWGDGGPPVWSVDEDILHHIESRRCF